MDAQAASGTDGASAYDGHQAGRDAAGAVDDGVTGQPDVDPCGGEVCNKPPAPTCADANTLRTYAQPGVCNSGKCTYPSSTKKCAFGCAKGTCKPDPCAAITCNKPPADTCNSKTQLKRYVKTGTCSAGVCSYKSKTVACAKFCSAGSCLPTWGWDYNLKHRCVASRLASGPNYYKETTDCPAPNNRWFVTNNAEYQGQTGTQCSGIQDQALPINAGGPLTLAWIPHTDEYGRKNWIINLKTDVMYHTHPCGSLVYTFFGFSDFIHFGGGPFPTPDKLGHDFRVKYDDWTPDGASRAIAFFAGEWNNKGVWLEIDLASAQWGDAYPSVADIVQVYKSSNFLWVEMYGPAMGYSIQRKVWQKVHVAWSKVIPDLIARGYLEAPVGGLAKAKTVGVGLATEVKNNAKTGASAEMWVTDWRVEP